MSKKTKGKKTKKTEEKILLEAKANLEGLSSSINKTAIALPSILSTNSNFNDHEALIQERFSVDFDIIAMLEEFFENLVELLKLRFDYNTKLTQTYTLIKKLKETKTIEEFRGNLQLLGICLNETENIIKQYEEVYTILFTEQALLQFQLLEQLLRFRQSDLPEFAKMLAVSLETFKKISKMVSTNK